MVEKEVDTLMLGDGALVGLAAHTRGMRSSECRARESLIVDRKGGGRG